MSPLLDTKVLTVTTASTSGLEVGMWITISDERPWWLKAWHWIIRKKIRRHFQITDTSATTLNILA